MAAHHHNDYDTEATIGCKKSQNIIKMSCFPWQFSSPQSWHTGTESSCSWFWESQAPQLWDDNRWQKSIDIGIEIQQSLKHLKLNLNVILDYMTIDKHLKYDWHIIWEFMKISETSQIQLVCEKVGRWKCDIILIKHFSDAHFF